jgi:hypothetical protein
MKEFTEPGKRVEDSLGEYELPFLQAVALRISVACIELVTRVADVLVLLARPRLLRPYAGLWLAELLRSPYRLGRSFEVVRVLKSSGQPLRELMYGETPLVTGLRAMRRAGVGPGSRVVDLLAGRGRALLAARWLGAEAHGVELLERHVVSVAGSMRRAGVSLVVGDALQEELGGFTHVFLNWTALGPETKARLLERLRTCRPGTRILTVTRPLEAEDFPVLGKQWLLFTWGFEWVWRHEYRPKSS